MSGVEYNTWKVADLKAQLKAKVTNLSKSLQCCVEFSDFTRMIYSNQL